MADIVNESSSRDINSRPRWHNVEDGAQPARPNGRGSPSTGTDGGWVSVSARCCRKTCQESEARKPKIFQQYNMNLSPLLIHK